MYTATLKSDIKNEEKRSRFVTVTFTDGTEQFDMEFRFALKTPIEDIKKTVKSALDELNAPVEDITGDVADYTPPTATDPTQAELDEQEWRKDWANLQEVDRLIEAQVLTGAEKAVTILRNKVKNNIKANYLN